MSAHNQHDEEGNCIECWANARWRIQQELTEQLEIAEDQKEAL